MQNALLVETNHDAYQEERRLLKNTKQAYFHNIKNLYREYIPPMTKPNDSTFVQGSFFEENYLVRTLGELVHSPEVALTELVANAWDAGATEVNISIPEDYDQKLIIEDNGTGLTKDEFHYRWMRLGYDRLKHQGKEVVFPKGVSSKRLAYGRNGVGRHGLLCFNNEYTVITNAKGKESTFVITTLSETEPFVIKQESFGRSSSVGTRLEVVINKNKPNPNKILEVISAKFLHDPNFKVYINRQTVPLESLTGLISSEPMKINGKELKVHFIDSQKTARSTIYQGIAFWQGGRLVGEPSWILGNEAIIDGRTTYAKRYTVVVESNDLAPYILEDWTGFKKDIGLNDVYKEIGNYVQKQFGLIAKDSIEETKVTVRNEFAKEFAVLSPLARYEVNEAIETITNNHPTAKPEVIEFAVEAIINLEKTRTGKALLAKLAKLSDEDINGLNELLEKWSVKDALTVLDEIDSRISVIEAIRKLANDENVDELHVLHPLVTSARWLFGPEFDSAEFASNNQLRTAVEKIFDKKIDKEVFNNYKKRPDIVVLQNSTVSVTGTEMFDIDSNLSTVNKILLIELKRGGFKLTRQERNQAQGYVEDFMNCGSLIGNPYIDAFVLGKEFSEKVQPITTVINENKVEMGKVRISTFSQLVDTAEKRLFGLRNKLSERYDDIPGIDLFRSATQLKVNFTTN